MARPLSDLKTGQKARVVRVDASSEIGQRIMEMGVTPGAEIRLLGAAPMGDPLAFEIRGYRLSLRRAEATLVEVESLRPDPT